MSTLTFQVSQRKGESVTRRAQLRHQDDDESLFVPADFAGGTGPAFLTGGCIRLHIFSGIGGGPQVQIEGPRLIAPLPGEFAIATLILDPPVNDVAAWTEGAPGFNFRYTLDWASLDADAFDGLRSYREVYEFDMRPAGKGRHYLEYLVSMVPNPVVIA